MTRPDRFTGNVGAEFHPVSHYSSPSDVLDDAALSRNEKRVILSSWASDMYAVDSHPFLREIPGIAAPMRVSDILAALRQLDDEVDRPATTTGAIAQGSRASGPRHLRIAIPKSRWCREANVQRYRKLLKTQLTDHERRYVEQRLAEELGETGSMVEPCPTALTVCNRSAMDG
jgi:hypothetical protein